MVAWKQYIKSFASFFELSIAPNELKEKINEWRSEVPENREAIINNINSAIQKYQNINDTYKKYKTILDRLDLGEVNLNQDFNAVQVASADKNFIPSLGAIDNSKKEAKDLRYCFHATIPNLCHVPKHAYK